MKKHFKKIIAVLVVVGTFGAYVLSQKISSDQITDGLGVSSAGFETLNPEVQNPTSTTPVPVAVTPKPKPVTSPKPVPSPKPKSAFKDGAYVGVVADAYYGPMQVKAVITNGKLSDVIFLQYPNDRRTSVGINNEAMPQLKSEAISIQSSNVNVVSGATQSSRGFRETLQSALDQAKVV